MLSIPIRVMGVEALGEDFCEDTRTTTVNCNGARIALRHPVAITQTLRIVNLENYFESDFRIVGPTAWAEAEVNEWGVECLEPDWNIWGIEFPPPLAGKPCVLAECRECGHQGFWPLTPMELEVLGESGVVQRSCSPCGKLTLWTFADISRRPGQYPPAAALAPLLRRCNTRKAWNATSTSAWP